MRFSVPDKLRKPVGIILLVLSGCFLAFYLKDESGNSVARDKYVLQGELIYSHECFLHGKRDRAKGIRLFLGGEIKRLTLPICVECSEVNTEDIKFLEVNGSYVIRWVSETKEYIDLKSGVEFSNRGVWIVSTAGFFIGLVFLLESRAKPLAKYWEQHKV